MEIINHLGDESYYEFDGNILKAYIALTPVEEKDNAFIDAIIDNAFREHADWFRQYLAMFAYTSHKRLPMLVLFGPRGTGKNAVTWIMRSMWPGLSTKWDGKKGGFQPEEEKRFAYVDENGTFTKEQYEDFKAKNGNEYFTVELKYRDPKTVRNNLCLALMSNNTPPMYVNSDELPTDKKDNQFFVYNMTNKVTNKDPDIFKKIERKIGHYVRTVLKDEFEKIQKQDLTDGCRYGIPVPITPEEEQMFQMNQTQTSIRADDAIIEIVNLLENNRSGSLSDWESDQKKVVSKGIIPIDLLRRGGGNLDAVRKELQRRGVLEPGESKVHSIYGRKKRCYHIQSVPEELEGLIKLEDN